MKKKYYIYQMNLTTLNILSLLILVITFLISYLINKNFVISCIKYLYTDSNVLKYLGLYLLYIIIHEILHSIAYIIYGAKFKNIQFGMEIEKGILYCLCKEDITRKNILNSLMFPLFYIGIITWIISMIFKFPMLFLLSVSNIMGSVGDIIMFLFIIKLDKNIKFSEFNDTTSFGIKTKKELTNVKPFGLKYIDTKLELEKNINKKINISKKSLIFICIIISILLINLLF